jgi:hypothetical protein
VNKSNLDTIREAVGNNKEIPQKYEAAILVALSHYPELKDTRIKFQIANHASVPYGTKPSMRTIFSSPEKRLYLITILEEAKDPMRQALLKNLPFDARVGVIGHELGHVVQYSKMGRLELINSLLSYMKPSFQRRIERAADLAAIVHGLGKQLLEHAVYIRSIPGYVQERESINKNYLKPKEIRQYLKSTDFFDKYQVG